MGHAEVPKHDKCDEFLHFLWIKLDGASVWAKASYPSKTAFDSFSSEVIGIIIIIG